MLYFLIYIYFCKFVSWYSVFVYVYVHMCVGVHVLSTRTKDVSVTY